MVLQFDQALAQQVGNAGPGSLGDFLQEIHLFGIDAAGNYELFGVSGSATHGGCSFGFGKFLWNRNLFSKAAVYMCKGVANSSAFGFWEIKWLLKQWFKNSWEAVLTRLNVGLLANLPHYSVYMDKIAQSLGRGSKRTAGSRRDLG